MNFFYIIGYYLDMNKIKEKIKPAFKNNGYENVKKSKPPCIIWREKIIAKS